MDRQAVKERQGQLRRRLEFTGHLPSDMLFRHGDSFWNGVTIRDLSALGPHANVTPYHGRHG